MRNNKGITMISLAITIIVLLIVTSITIYNGLGQLGIKRVNCLHADIESISTKVAEYYLKNEVLPVFSNKYVENKQELEEIFEQNGAKESDDIININDGNDYYVIDLSKLDNLTLNYGEDYKQWPTTSDANIIQNVYIINYVTHQIYFPKGVKGVDEKYFVRYPDKNIVTPITLEDIEDEWEITINNISGNIIDENNISVVADITLTELEEKYDLNSLEYAWSETNDESEVENMLFTKFNVNNTNEGDITATLASKALSNTAEYYYLWVKALDINGKTRYQYAINSASPLTGNLPSNYQSVEYLESTGTQYINTDYIPTIYTNMEIEFEYMGTDSTANWIPLCGARSGTKSTYFTYFILSNGSVITPNYGEYDPGTNSEICDLQLNTKYNLKNIAGNFYLNGQLKSSTTKVLTSGTTPIYIFAIGYNTSVDNRKAHLKLYNFRLYEENQIVRNFIPCYRISDNVKGLYDLVEGHFYINQGTGDDFIIPDNNIEGD